ncbi:MAG: hypothetical protein ACOC80_05110 [Petrotogales bacterium]
MIAKWRGVIGVGSMASGMYLKKCTDCGLEIPSDGAIFPYCAKNYKIKRGIE